MTDFFKSWIAERGISEVECLVPDMNGVLRGKVWPAQKFVKSAYDGSLRMPQSIFNVTVTGEYADVDVSEEDAAYRDPDVSLHPDPESICVAPGFKTPTAFVFADTTDRDGKPTEIAPRRVLQRILDLYDKEGWAVAVAPELEFYLTQTNVDPDLPLQPPTGRSGRAETAPQPYGLEAVNEYEDIIEDIYDHSEIASLHLDTMIHESGTAQLEINFNHGAPIHLCDQVMVFKRIVRQVALSHGVYATFMAKPMEFQPGSAMHQHISLHDKTSGKNLFSDGRKGHITDLFKHFVGGLQTYLPEITPLYAPNVNSFRRMRPNHSAPINLQWGLDNRTCGLRVPIADGASTRIENRLPGSDANPYLAIAAALVCGYIGIRDKLEPMPLIRSNAYLKPRTLPKTLQDSLDRFALCAPVIELLGAEFVKTFLGIKAAELDAFEGVISSWERDHLLLKV
ncbi:MAG: glutamine synthetase family protein [Alphaproteobacteria bacterium]|nr:glutamine synthetase family protein [Alphaproteobacteria bacterium]MDE2042323.1 glutamine synthetase [Alphaproteobacteria bacterium]MDE2339884.1 glutamine synthetase [Alphaproteobacteria bacterium]